MLRVCRLTLAGSASVSGLVMWITLRRLLFCGAGLQPLCSTGIEAINDAISDDIYLIIKLVLLILLMGPV